MFGEICSASDAHANALEMPLPPPQVIISLFESLFSFGEMSLSGLKVHIKIKSSLLTENSLSFKLS